MSVCLSVGTYVASRHNFPTRTLFIFLDWIKLPVLKYLAYDFFRSPKKRLHKSKWHLFGELHTSIEHGHTKRQTRAVSLRRLEVGVEFFQLSDIIFWIFTRSKRCIVCRTNEHEQVLPTDATFSIHTSIHPPIYRSTTAAHASNGH